MNEPAKTAAVDPALAERVADLEAGAMQLLEHAERLAELERQPPADAIGRIGSGSAPERALISVLDFGAVGDGALVTDAAIGLGSTQLSSEAAAFSPSDQGKLVVVQGAGAAGAPLASQIESVAGGIATLADAAATAVEKAEAVYGTDDQASLNAACASLAASGGRLFFPARRFMVSAAITIPGGVTAWGSGTEYGAVEVAPNRGAIICAGAAIATGVVRLDKEQSVLSGEVGACLEGLIVDGSQVAGTCIRLLGRRNYVRGCQAYRATSKAVAMEGQNGYLLFSIAGNNNAGTPVYVTGSDQKIIGNQIRQGSIAQLELNGVTDCLVAENHIFGGGFGTVEGTTGNDILITGHSQQIMIENNVLDGTHDDHIKISPTTGGVCSYILIQGNQFWSVNGTPKGVNAMVRIDTSASATAASRAITISNNIVFGLEKSWVGVTNTAGNVGAIETVIVTGTNGFGLEAFYSGKRPDVLTGNAFRTVSGKGVQSSNSGTAVFTGDGVTTVFEFEHGLSAAPASVVLQAASAAAMEAAGMFWTATATKVAIHFKAAPAAGANNTSVSWRADL